MSERMTDSLLSMIQHERQVEAVTLWSDIERMREWAPCPDLPLSLGEFNQQVRALTSADLITVDEDGVITYIPPRPVVVVAEPRVEQMELFA